MAQIDPKEFLLFALNHYKIGVISEEGKVIDLERNYSIEIEGQNLFKLLHEGQVIAPFADAEELCNFIKQDMLANE